MSHPWRRRPLTHQLSRYLDGELNATDRDAVGEELAFDAAARQQLRSLGRVDDLVRGALAPAVRPDAVATAAALAQAVRRGRATERVRRSHCPDRRLIGAAAVASLGLVVTAGIALVGLRRRGVV